MSFDSLGLRAELLRAVHEQEYTTPTPVQAQAIPVILAGRDLMAAAQTGTGKTAGFTLPLLQRLLESEPAEQTGKRPVRALILVPTRELCAQVAESVRTYGKHVSIRGTQIFGGVGMQPQIDALRRGVDIVIATPGRLLDHVQRRTIDLSRVEILVLDEADRMLDMGFIAPIKRVLSLLPAQRQNLLFSATFADDIRELADRLMNSPEMIDVTPPNKPVEAIEQIVFHVDAAQKPDALAHLFLEKGWVQALVFTRTKHGADRLAKRLLKAGISADAIHGNKSQNARTRALATFKEGKVCALVATDIAARGLDIDGLPQVVNFELPHVPEDYVHRIGRTGRAGAIGHAISLVSRDELRQLRAIERVIGRTLPAEVIAGFEPEHGVPAPTRDGAPRGQNRPQRQPQRRGDGAPPPRRGDGVPRPQGQQSGQQSPGGNARNGGPRADNAGRRNTMPPRDDYNRGPMDQRPYPRGDSDTYGNTLGNDDALSEDLDVIDEADDARGNREPLPQSAQQPGVQGGRGARPGGGRDRRGGGVAYAPPGVMSTRSGDTQGGWGAPRPTGPRGGQGRGDRPGRPGRGNSPGYSPSNPSGSSPGNSPGNSAGNSPGSAPDSSPRKGGGTGQRSGAGARSGPRSGPRYGGGQPRTNDSDSGFSRKRYGYPEERAGRVSSAEPRRYGSSSEVGQRGGSPTKPTVIITQRGQRPSRLAGARAATPPTSDESNSDE